LYKYVVCKYVVMTDGSTVMWCCTIVVTDVDHIANTNLHTSCIYQWQNCIVYIHYKTSALLKCFEIQYTSRMYVT